MTKLIRSNFWIKLRNWEFWPFGILYFPVFFHWAWLCYKARSFFFFTASNPGIEYGGMLFESKIKIMEKIPDNLKPTTLFFNKSDVHSLSTDLLIENNLHFPLIIKPDIGERGWGVFKANNAEEFAYHLKDVTYDILIQEYIDYPIELGIFYMRKPNKNKGRVTSIVRKKMLSVTGDGSHTIRELMEGDFRAKLYIHRFQNSELLDRVLKRGEEMTLEDIGNHCRGTTFLNANKLINKRLNHTFDQISTNIDGFYFGRFDLKCASLDDLYNGRVKIMELNGAGSEPGHIYHPGSSLREAYSSIFYHQRKLLEISMINKKLGIDYMSFKDGLKSIFALRNYRKSRKLAA